MPVYPSHSFNLISDLSYNLVNDVVMSVEFSLSGNIHTEAGFSFFLTKDFPLSGGGTSTALRYSNDNTGYNGVRNSIAGFGVDTAGSFALSSLTADGVNNQNLIPNSVTARGGFSENFSFTNLGSYNKALPANVTLVRNDNKLRTIRYRVGNLGRTMYLDYRDDYSNEFTPIGVIDIGDRVDLDESYRVGIGYTSPFTLSAVADPTAIVRITSIHIEGLEPT